VELAKLLQSNVEPDFAIQTRTHSRVTHVNAAKGKRRNCLIQELMNNFEINVGLQKSLFAEIDYNLKMG